MTSHKPIALGRSSFFWQSIRHLLKVVPCVRRGQAPLFLLAVSTTLTFFQTTAASAQVQQAWSAQYRNGALVPAEDKAIKVVVDNDGNCIVTGQGGNLDYHTVKYNSAGGQLWAAVYDGPNAGADQPRDLAVDSMGNVFVTGYSTIDASGLREIATIKYAPTGERLWVDRLSSGPGTSAVGYGVIADADADVYVFGFVGAFNLLAKYDSLGNRLWTVLQPSGASPGFNSAALDSQGNIVVTRAGGGTSQTTKYSAAGEELWTRIYTNYGGSELALDAADNIYVVGNALIKYAADGTLLWAQEGVHADLVKVGGSGSVYVAARPLVCVPGVCEYQLWTSKFDAYGNRLWTNATVAEGPIYQPGSRVWPLGLSDVEDLWVTVSGPGAVGTVDYTTTRYNSNGVKQSVRSYDGPWGGNDLSRAVTVDKNGNAFVTGFSRGSVGNDFATVKYNPDASMAWVARYDSLTSSGNHQAFFIALDRWKNAVVAGNSSGFGGNSDSDYAVVKYTPNGTRVWAVRYASPSNAVDTVKGLAVDTNGNVFITGSTRTLKYDASGNLQWSLPMSGVGVVVDSNGSPCLAGFSTSWSVIKLNPDGTTNWTRTTNPFASIRTGPTHLAVDAPGNVYVGGTVVMGCDRASCYSYAGVAKYSPAGDLQWVWLPPTYYIDVVARMTLSSNGDLYLARRGYGNDYFKISNQGQTVWNVSSPSSSYLPAIAPDADGNLYALLDNQFTLMAFNTNGSLAWRSNYFADSFGASVAVHSNGIYLTGNVPNANGRTDIVTIKCDKNGNQLWMRNYDNPFHQDDWARNIAIDADGGVYVVGYQGGQNGLVEMVTIKYAELSAIQVQADQTAQLQFFGTPGQPYRFQASTNLASWEDLGIAHPDTNNIARFLDTNAPSYPRRFYRMLIP